MGVVNSSTTTIDNSDFMFFTSSTINRLGHLRSNPTFISQLVKLNSVQLILFKKSRYNEILVNDTGSPSLHFISPYSEYSKGDDTTKMTGTTRISQDGHDDGTKRDSATVWSHILTQWAKWNNDHTLTRNHPKLNIFWLGVMPSSSSSSSPSSSSSCTDLIETPTNENIRGFPLFALDITEYTELITELNKTESLKWISGYPEIANLSNNDATLFSYANTFLDYIQKHQYCSQCGSKMIPRDAGSRLECLKQSQSTTECNVKPGNNILYPRIDPVVIIALYNSRGEILLGHNKRVKRAQYMYSCFSGFMESGESFEQSCQREVYEETGISIDINDIKIIASQPWPFPANLMVGCIGFIRDPQVDIRLDLDDELDDVRWFTPLQIDQGGGVIDDKEWIIPPITSIAGTLIKYACQQRGKF